MNKKLTLVIMAAGMGSRFGGFKQMEPVGPHGEFIIDYSIHDAIEAGFDKFVFIIKQEHREFLEEHLGKHLRETKEVLFVEQDSDVLPCGYHLDQTRVKPLGTGHAIYCVKDVVGEPFAVINSDDFYGRESYQIMADYLRNLEDDHRYAMVGYPVPNTLTEHGSVNRGICVLEGQFLNELIESSVEQREGKIVATPKDGTPFFEVNETFLASMNFFGFSPSFFEGLEEEFRKFLETNWEELETKEFYLPEALKKQIEKGKAKVEVLRTKEKWYGMTYREDKDSLVKKLQELTNLGLYPSDEKEK